MAEIINLDDRHIIVQADNGVIHVVPVTVFEQLRDGKLEIDKVDDWKDIMRVVVREWLEMVVGC